MQPNNSKDFFIKYIKNNNLTYANLTLDQLIDQFTKFYKDIRTKSVDINNDGDMVLVQWGTYDWGNGEYFEFDIIRQFIEFEKDGDDAISQLHCTFYYTTNEAYNKLNGNKWFKTPNEIENIKIFIYKSNFYSIIKNIPPIKKDIFIDRI